jgi:two-component system cell cycle response regulator CtrA
VRVLLVTSHARMAAGIADHLQRAEAVCEVTETGEGLELGGLGYDALVVDLDDEPELVHRLRGAGVDLPIIGLARDAEAHHRIELLRQGADDVLAVPFLAQELVLRIRSLTRRHNSSDRVIAIGPLTLDLDQRQVYRDREPLHFTKREYAFFEVLALRKDRIVTQEQILGHMYRLEDEPEVKIIQVFVCKIRKKLGPAARFLETVWGRGYVLRDRATPASQ